jgi:RNA polymerase sigma-70 factor, ECF subfamily
VSTQAREPTGQSVDEEPGSEGSLDEAAVAELFRACARDVHAYAISLLGERAAAEDVTALAFERLFRLRGRLDPRRGTARAWLFTIARNAALDELRRRSRDARILPETAPVVQPGADDDLELVERRATVRAALARVGGREREIVLLKFHGQLSNGELARVLGISESNVGTRLHRALTALREACGEPARREVA